MEQMSIWSFLDSYETPLIPYEQQKKGTRGWIIECSGLFLRENGFKKDQYGVCTRPIVFESDTKPDGSQHAHTLKGPFHGWWGGNKEVFERRPSWSDCLLHAKKNRAKDEPEDVIFYDHKANWDEIWSYEDGY